MRLCKATITSFLALLSYADGAPAQQDQSNNQVKPAKPPPPAQNLVNDNAPIQIGSHNAIRISSNQAVSQIQPVVSAGGRRKVYSLRHDQASYLSVHFSNMDLPPSCSLEITDASGDQYTMMRGRGRGNVGTFWARHVKGDAMEIVVQCNGKNQEAIFEIDDYVSGFSDLGDTYPDKFTRHLRSSSPNESQAEMIFPYHPTARQLAICGSDDKQNAVCYKNSHPTEYEKARAVARLYINGSGACTGWLVGPNNMLLTNEHCIASNSDALNTDFEFMGEEATCSSTSGNCWMCDRGAIYDAVGLVKVNADKDFALIEIAASPVSTYGYLDLDPRPTVNGEEIYIPQHPGGRAKEMGIFDPLSPGGICSVLNSNTGCCGCGGAYNDVRYTCDTEGGSSGSPVLARSSHRVVALHHCGGCGNMGVPVEKFVNDIVYDVYGSGGLPNFNGPTDPPANPTDPPTDPNPPSNCDHTFEIRLLTDNYGEETTWELKDSNGYVLATEDVWTTGNLADATLYQYSMCVPSEQLTFTIRDSQGDGICCGYGTGDYQIYVDGVMVHDSTGTFGYFESVPLCTSDKAMVKVELQTDNYPKETSWDLKTSSGATVMQSVAYSSRLATYTSGACLSKGQSYSFTIRDSAGDGLCCKYGSGSYKVFADQTQKASGASFGYSEQKTISV